jgi:FkbM family methyltransferase
MDNLMQKILNLHRLDAGNRKKVLQYFFKRVIRSKTTASERLINDYYAHLIRYGGILQSESDHSFVSHYPKLGVTLKTRKRPSSDLEVFSQIYKYLEYEPLVKIFKDNFPERHSLKIIDAGSNIGLTTVFLSKFFPDSEFIAVEPDPDNFNVMSTNFDLNKINTVHKIEGGVWSRNSFLKIVTDFRDKKHWSIRVEETQEPTDLEAFAINSLIEKYGWDQIDILKIDIEGSEKELFTGKNSNLSFLKITKCLAIEIHDEFECRDEIYTILHENSFKFMNSGELTIAVNQTLL